MDTASMQVAVRLRPMNEKEVGKGQRSCCQVIGNESVVIQRFRTPNQHLKSQQAASNEYAYDIAFNEDATQEEVYSQTVKEIVPTILDGYQATVFAYGATGAGKTHTMMGAERDGSADFDELDDDIQVDGIIPRALADIFRIVRQRKEEEAETTLTEGTTFGWKVYISYLEVYNEQIRDLLKPSKKTLSIREDQMRGVIQVAGLHHELVSTPGQVLQLLASGNRNRKTEPTAANQVSSRSHAVIQVIVQHTTTTLMSTRAPKKSVREGKLSLIDLAGSERASSTQNRGMRLMEGANINKSLLALANCINSLSEQTRKQADKRKGRVLKSFTSKVQYRDSKLTHLLKNSLEGNVRLVMIANVNPSNACYDESHNTLKYANRAKDIKIRPKANVMTSEMTSNQRIEQLESENGKLREALADTRAELERLSLCSRSDVEMVRPASTSLTQTKELESRRSSTVHETVGSWNHTDTESNVTDELQEVIEKLKEEKRKLEEQVGALSTENAALQHRVQQADVLLRMSDSKVHDENLDEDVNMEVEEPKVATPHRASRNAELPRSPISGVPRFPKRSASASQPPAHPSKLPKTPTTSRTPFKQHSVARNEPPRSMSRLSQNRSTQPNYMTKRNGRWVSVDQENKESKIPSTPPRSAPANFRSYRSAVSGDGGSRATPSRLRTPQPSHRF